MSKKKVLKESKHTSLKLIQEPEVDLIKGLMKLSEEDLLIFVYRLLCKFYKSKNVILQDGFVFAEGQDPVILLAHLDTVFKHPPIDIFYDPEERVLWSPDGMGADDRAGVYAIIELIMKGHRPHIIFTLGEEVGGIGAEDLVQFTKDATTNQSFCPFKEAKFMIQLDRRGLKDCVFYDCDNKEFEQFVNSFGFVTAWGTFTDISVIAPEWGIAAVNLSVGYFNEHSSTEHLFLDALDLTIDRVSKMIEKSKEVSFFKYVRKPNRYFYPYSGRMINFHDINSDKNSDLGFGYYNYGDDFLDNYEFGKTNVINLDESKDAEKIECTYCGQKVPLICGSYYHFGHNERRFVCDECINNIF